jgi:hypothetical protein
LKALVVVHFLKIDRSSVSIYLGADDHDVANAEMVLGGSYDKAKLGRELFTMEMVDPHSVCLRNTATNSVNVTSIEGVSDWKTVKSDSPTSEGTPFLLDTEAPWWSVPSDIFNLISTAFGGLKRWLCTTLIWWTANTAILRTATATSPSNSLKAARFMFRSTLW